MLIMYNYSWRTEDTLIKVLLGLHHNQQDENVRVRCQSMSRIFILRRLQSPYLSFFLRFSVWIAAINFNCNFVSRSLNRGSLSKKRRSGKPTHAFCGDKKSKQHPSSNVLISFSHQYSQFFNILVCENITYQILWF